VKNALRAFFTKYTISIASYATGPRNAQWKYLLYRNLREAQVLYKASDSAIPPHYGCSLCVEKMRFAHFFHTQTTPGERRRRERGRRESDTI
jgi:hypothetical protein